MAIGKSQATLKINSLAILFGKISIVKNGKIDPSYSEAKTAEYMKKSNTEINVKT